MFNDARVLRASSEPAIERHPMRDDATLTVASVLTVLLTMLHLGHDVVLGISPPGLSNLTPLVYWVLFLYAALALAGRRWGYVIILVASVPATGVAILHMTGRGLLGASRDGSAEEFFFVSTLFALGGVAPLCALLAVRGLWRLRRRGARVDSAA